MTEITARPRWILIGAIALIAFNLRAAITSVPTLANDIQQATGWNDIQIGALTALPVMSMGAFALAVPALSQRLGRTQTVWLAMGVLVVAMTSRLASSVPGVLYLSALMAGAGIALGAGLVPGIVREQMPDAVGMVTGLWTASMFTGATAAAALTVPIAQWTGSWTVALAVWAIPAAIAWIGWTITERPYLPTAPAPSNLGSVPARSAMSTSGIRQLPWRSRTAWAITAYLTLNSVVFYSAIAWLAPSFNDRGWSQESSGLLFGLFSAAQVVAALLLPSLAQRVRARRTLFAGTAAIAAIALLFIGFAPLTWTFVVLIAFGISHSGGFTIAMAMLSEYTSGGAASARLTAMAFSVTFLVAALGPLATGALLQWTDSWPVVYSVLAFICLAQIPAIVALRRNLVVN